MAKKSSEKKGKLVNMTIELSQDLINELSKLAAYENKTLGEVIDEAIKCELKKERY